MTYSLIDRTRTKGSPVVLLLFRYGTGGSQVLSYTNSESTLDHDGIAYRPIPLDLDSIKSKGVAGKTEFSIKVPNDSEISQLFRYFPPPDPVTVTVFHGHRSDPDAQFIVVWTGRVLSAQPGAGLETTLTCEWAGIKLRRPGLFYNWQYTCPHDLYGPRCKADKPAATFVTAAVSVNTYAVEVQDGWNGVRDPERFVNGSASWATEQGTEYRSIIDISDDNTLILANVARGLVPGASITLTLGCDRSFQVCTDVHNNINNFGGCPWIPTENPIGRDIFS